MADKITYKDNQLTVSDNPIIPFIEEMVLDQIFGMLHKK